MSGRGCVLDCNTEWPSSKLLLPYPLPPLYCLAMLYQTIGYVLGWNPEYGVHRASVLRLFLLMVCFCTAIEL